MLSCNDDTIGAVVHHDGIDAIQTAMQINRHEAAIQKQGCIVLRSFAALSDEVLDDECIMSILATMQEHEKDAEIQREGCLVLAVLIVLLATTERYIYIRVLMSLNGKKTTRIEDAIVFHKNAGEMESLGRRIFCT